MELAYPKHIYEPIRVEIASVYLKRELRKFLPSIRGKAVWNKIDGDIDQWFDKSPNIGGPRDFWNGFWGVAMGFKLKDGLIQVITAENIKWEFNENLPLDDKLKTGTYPYISEKLAKEMPNASYLRDFFKAEPKLAKKWLNVFEKHAKNSEERDQFPIIARGDPKDKDTFIAIDGNRRVILSVLQGKPIIPAYVGRFTSGEKPENFWLPTSFLMELVVEGRLMNDIEGTTEELKKLIKLSKSGEYELKNRVLIGSSEFRQELRKNLGWETSDNFAKN